jgi:phosphate-selective porin OprO and OprP
MSLGGTPGMTERNGLGRTLKIWAFLWPLLFVVYAQPSLSSALDSAGTDSLNKEETRPPAGLDFSWREGLYLGHHYRDIFTVTLGGLLQVDGGYIDANQVLENAYPALQGWDGALRNAKFNLTATFYQVIKAKIEYDFADQERAGIQPKFQDVWIASKKNIPLIGYITAGNMKEPFSLEALTGSGEITFMERSLPTVAFSPNYNLGFKLNNTVLKDRMTWGAGGYWNTQDLNHVYSGGDLKDQFSTANGYSLAARVTGLPWYEEEGRRLLHLGVCYNFRAWNAGKEGAEEKFSTRPESYLTAEKLADTGNIPATRSNLINGELAWVWGPLSVQGEYFRAFLNAEGAPDFRGYYVYGSLLLTGEHRSYDSTNGVFDGVTLEKSHNLLPSGWGAWELAARYSYINLDSSGVNGGRENNFTAGLNWYLSPNLRFLFNYIRVNTTNLKVDDGRASIYQARFQIAF